MASICQTEPKVCKGDRERVKKGGNPPFVGRVSAGPAICMPTVNSRGLTGSEDRWHQVPEQACSWTASTAANLQMRTWSSSACGPGEGTTAAKAAAASAVPIGLHFAHNLTAS